jgi:predicted amidohydrolase YtcJ
VAEDLIIETADVRKSYGSVQALAGLDLRVPTAHWKRRRPRCSNRTSAAKSAANGADGPMHQLARLQLVHPNDIPRFDSLRVAANIQGLWAYRDEETLELVEPAIGSERAARLYPLGSLERAGATLVGGSDWSVTSMNPLAAIEIAVTCRGARQPAGPA